MAGEIRQPIDVGALQRYIEKIVPEIGTPIDVKQFGFGQSNPTYQLTSPNGHRYVMRKKPPGKLLSKTAHQVEREYRIIHALATTDVPAPKTYCLCEDTSIVGTPFYIMEFLDGRIITDPWLPDVSPEERTEMWRSAILTLAKFHTVPPASVNLSDFGRPTNFYDRQIKTLSTISSHQAASVDVDTQKPVGPIPHFPDMVDFFSQKSTQPRDRGTLIHGDYKIDNLVFHPKEPRVIGILDWEMSTVGHPLSDLVNLTSPWAWIEAGLDAPFKTTSSTALTQPSEFAPGKTPGLPTIDTVISWYAQAAGWDPSREMKWGIAFGGLRGSVIMQGIAARYARRQASGLTAKTYAEQMGPYGEWTWSIVETLIRDGRNDAKL